MNVILINPTTGRTRNVKFRLHVIVILVVFSMLLVASTGVGVGYWYKGTQAQGENELARFLKQDIARNAESILEAKKEAEDHLTAMTVRMAELQSRLMRLDALGERLVGVAKLKGGEFDFSQSPALGGPEEGGVAVEFQRPDFLADLDQLTVDIEARESQLHVLESLLENRKLRNDVAIAGRPITWGWLSSRFGRRTDPFTGRLAWHKGLDFAGKDGADIVSVGAGVVTWAGERYGYGLMVEISHGDGLSTRYAHAKEIVVSVGDIVKQGEVLAKIGSTGRSTGPHVHFEVVKNGKNVDPARYVNRNRS